LFPRQGEKMSSATRLARVSGGTSVARPGWVPLTVAAGLAGTPPGQSRLFGDVVWVLFVAVQAADGVCTYVGLQLFGIGMEGNPLIGWHAATFGIGTALVSAKLLAATCAAFLHSVGRHITLALLTIVHLVGAVWPWSRILWP